MAKKRAREKASGERKRSAPMAFSPDPDELVVALAGSGDTELGPAGPRPGARGGATPVHVAKPSHVFRVLRPEDLVVFDVRGWNLGWRRDRDLLVLVPENDEARLEVRFPFQHLGERAFFKAGDPGPPEPDPGDEPRQAPPIQALAARGSRLVFAVPSGESIQYSIEGVLAAMSRLPLLVVPLATPATFAKTPGKLGPTPIVTLPGGLMLGRALEGELIVANARVSRAGAARPSPEPAGISDVLATAIALRTARAFLAEEPALDLSGRNLTTPPPPRRSPSKRSRASAVTAYRGVGGLLIPLPGRIPASKQRPRAPRGDETAIEAPFRLIISPSVQGGFAHVTGPGAAPTDPSRVELWHTRLGVRKVDPEDGSVSVDESPVHPQRTVRAIWARDKNSLGPDEDPPAGDSPFRMSLNPRDRVILVRQSSDPKITTPQPVDAKRLYLSSLGAYLDLHGRWDTKPYSSPPHQLVSILSWDHVAPMGRDQFVQVIYPGYLFPFGHRAAIVKLTERRILDPIGPQAQLIQRKFLIIMQPVRTYDARNMPFRQITLRPLVTPDIRDPLAPGTPNAPGGEDLFWPTVGTAKFAFTLDCIDHAGQRARLQAPLLFVAERLPLGPNSGKTAEDIRTTYRNDPQRPIPASGTSVAFAPPETGGDTVLETAVLSFVGEPGPPGSSTSTPSLEEADVVVPAMRHLAPASPVAKVSYPVPYVNLGFTGINKDAQVFLELKTPATISFSQGTDRSGGFVQPDLPVRGLSRALGAIGDIEDTVAAAPTFNPQKFLAGVFPKLFGLFELTDILKAVGLDGAPSFLTEGLDRIAALLADLEALRATVIDSVTRLGEDAASAATAPLRAQADAAANRLAAIRAKLEPRVVELKTAVEDLLDLDNPSSVADVTAAVSDALDKLVGLVDDIGAVVREQPLPAPVKAGLERLVNALDPVLDAAKIVDMIDQITQFVNGVDPAGLAVRARFDWRPTLTNFKDVPDEEALFVVKEDGFLLSVEARASGTDGVGADVLAELRQFSLQLFPGEPLLRLAFDRIAFRAASGRKPEVDVVFKGIEFVGVLGFIETLKQLIPFDGFSDPPYLDVTTEGVVAGFDLALPAVAVGVFSLENISLGADARVPFLGDEALTVGFYFCTREKPFRLTVMMIGGGGFVGIRLSPKGLVLLEMALEAGASLSVNLGVASGSVSVMVGVYLRLESDAGSLTGYFRIRGEVDVLGLISASITLELSLTYEFDTGKMVGRASITIEVDILFVSFSVSVSCERRLAGSNGDPTFAELIGVRADGTSPAWAQYCGAFASEV